jgi:uncharacterized membrane protein
VNNSRVEKQDLLPDVQASLPRPRVRVFIGLPSTPGVLLVMCLLLLVAWLWIPFSFLQIGLAVPLVLFGPGLSLLAVLFPQPNALDTVERLALGGALSLTIGGITGVVLAWSTWGLKENTLLVAMALFHLGCFLIVYRRRRGIIAEAAFRRPRSLRSRFDWLPTTPRDRMVTLVLAILVISGGWRLVMSLLGPPTTLPMTAFYLLGEQGMATNYITQGQTHTPFAVMYGIENLEAEAAQFQVRALVDGREVGRTQPVELEPGEIHDAQVVVRLWKEMTGMVKVDFVLYRAGQPYRTLYLWLDIAAPAGEDAERGAVDPIWYPPWLGSIESDS